MGSTLSKLDLKPPPTYLWTWTKYGQAKAQCGSESMDSDCTEDFQIEFNLLKINRLNIFLIYPDYPIPWTMNGQNDSHNAIGQ